MGATTIRIRAASHQALKRLAAETGKSLQDVLDEAIEARRRQLYLEGLASDYEALQKDPAAWEDYKKEMRDWDVTNLDGLEGL